MKENGCKVWGLRKQRRHFHWKPVWRLFSVSCTRDKSAKHQLTQMESNRSQEINMIEHVIHSSPRVNDAGLPPRINQRDALALDQEMLSTFLNYLADTFKFFLRYTSIIVVQLSWPSGILWIMWVLKWRHFFDLSSGAPLIAQKGAV